MPPVTVNPAPVPPVSTVAAPTREQAKSYLKRIYSGRMNRMTYFFGGIAYAILYWVALGLITSGLRQAGSMGETLASLVGLAASILNMILSWSFSVRRAHDIGKKWTYLLWMLIPLVNLVFLVILLVRRGDQKENEFGPMTKPGIHLQEMLGLD